MSPPLVSILTLKTSVVISITERLAKVAEAGKPESDDEGI
jgi:hypothetical protein